MGVAVSKISMLTHCQALTQACNYCEGQSSVLYVTYTSPAFLSLLLANPLCVCKREILKLYELRIKNKHDQNLKALKQHVSMAACLIISRSLLLKAEHLRGDKLRIIVRERMHSNGPQNEYLWWYPNNASLTRLTGDCMHLCSCAFVISVSGETLVNVLDCKKDMGLWHGVLTVRLNATI